MSFVDFFELPARNVGDGVSEKVTCHWQKHMVLKTFSCMRQNIPLLQQTKFSPATNFELVKLPQIYTIFCARFHGR
jgi:hypothetical protein